MQGRDDDIRVEEWHCQREAQLHTDTWSHTQRHKHREQTQRETIMHGGKSQPQGHNCSQATVTYQPRWTRGSAHKDITTEKCTQTGTQPHPHKNTVQCTRTVSYPKMQPTSPTGQGPGHWERPPAGLGWSGQYRSPWHADCRWGLMCWPGGPFSPYTLGSSPEVGQDLSGPQHWVHKEEATGALTY